MNQTSIPANIQFDPTIKQFCPEQTQAALAQTRGLDEVCWGQGTLSLRYDPRQARISDIVRSLNNHGLPVRGVMQLPRVG